MGKDEDECLISSLSAFFSLFLRSNGLVSLGPFGFPPTQFFKGFWTSQYTKARSMSMSR